MLGTGLLAAAAACTSTTEDASPAEGAERDPLVVPVFCRSAWGATPATSAGTHHGVERLTVHHTAVVLKRAADAPGQLRAIQGAHQGEGWPDIAYHYLIDVEGNVYAGRDPDTVGDTFTSYDPAGHLLVCLLGDFDQQRLPRVQRDSLAGMLAWGAGHYSVSPSTIAGHDHFARTSCPGRHVDEVIDNDTLRNDVEAILADGAPKLDVLCGREGAEQVAAVEAG